MNNTADVLLGQNPGFGAAEAYKFLRTNLDFSLPTDEGCKIICSVTTLEALCDKVAQSEMQPILTYEGKAKKGSEYMEFYPEEDSVRQVVLQLFYEETAG